MYEKMKPETALSIAQSQLHNCKETIINTDMDNSDKLEIAQLITLLHNKLMNAEYDYAHRI